MEAGGGLGAEGGRGWAGSRRQDEGQQRGKGTSGVQADGQQ